MTDTIIILAGGVSSRMKNSKNLKLSSKKTDQANNRSKGLIEIGGKPFINYLINNIVKAGFKEIIRVRGTVNYKNSFLSSKFLSLTQLLQIDGGLRVLAR